MISIEGRVDDLFELQDRLSEKIVTTIAPHVRAAGTPPSLTKASGEPRRVRLMLRGLDLLYRLRRTDFNRAREMFDQSIHLDPGYAAPYALLALWYSIQVGQGWSGTTGGTTTARPAASPARLWNETPSMPWRWRSAVMSDRCCLATTRARSPCSIGRSPRAPTRPSPGPEAARPTATWGTRPRPSAEPRSACGSPSSTRTSSMPTVHWDSRPTRPVISRRPSSGAARPCLRIRTSRQTFDSSRPACRPRDGWPRRSRSARALLTVEPGFHVGPFCSTHAIKDPARRAAFRRAAQAGRAT